MEELDHQGGSGCGEIYNHGIYQGYIIVLQHITQRRQVWQTRQCGAGKGKGNGKKGGAYWGWERRTEEGEEDGGVQQRLSGEGFT